MKSESGFTIFELLITVTLIAVLATLAAPSFTDSIRRNRLATKANDIIAASHSTRNEAINRGLSVQLEPIVAGADWSAGWYSRVDGNGDNDFDDHSTPEDPANDPDFVIRYYDPVEQATLTLTDLAGNTPAAADRVIRYNPDGITSHQTGRMLTLVAGCGDGNNMSRNIRILFSGVTNIVSTNCP